LAREIEERRVGPAPRVGHAPVKALVHK